MLNENQLNEWDRYYSWHPFSQMKEYCDWPQLHVERGLGCWLWDTDGNRYLDTNASIWTNTLGHNHPALNAALTKQLKKIAHSTYLGLSHPVGATLGKELTKNAPDGLERCFFSDNGSNAVEIALKLSLQYWQLEGYYAKNRVIGMEGGYHGDTIGTMAVGDSGRFHNRFKDWFLDTWHFPAPKSAHPSLSTEESLETLVNYLKNKAEEVSCLIMEPFVQGAAGMQLQPPGFLKAIEQICHDFNIHLILDEVFVGFGRLGSLYACTSESVRPDFLCLAKGLSAGYLPLAATLIQSKVYEACLGNWSEGRTFFHGHTFGANPLGCAVAIENIKQLNSLIRSGTLKQTIEYFGKALENAFSKHLNVCQLRHYGLCAAIELCPSDATNSWAVEDRMGWKVCLEARNHELNLRPLGDCLLIAPPLVITHEEIDFMCAQITKTLKLVCK